MRPVSAKKPAALKDDFAEPNTACATPKTETFKAVQKRALSGLGHSKSSSVIFIDPMQHFDSSDEEQCTFQPKINANAKRMMSQKKLSIANTSDLLYKDAFDRKARGREYQEIEKANLVRTASRTKIGTNSVKLIWKKMQSSLSNLITNAEDMEAEGFLSFIGLGTVLHRIGLFQNLEFIPSENKGEQSSVNINQAKVKPERLAKEIAFHENLWKVCSLASNKENGISSDIVLKVLIIFLEDKTPVEESSSLLLETMDIALESNGITSKRNQSVYLSLKEERGLWTTSKLVSEFRGLFDDKTSFMSIYSSANLIQAHNIIENDKQYNFSFKPQITKKAAVLDNRYFNERLLKSISFFQPNHDHKNMKPRYNRLHNYSSYIQDKKNIKLEERIREELSPCTFTPQTTPYKKSRTQGFLDSKMSANQLSLSPNKTRYFDQTVEAGSGANRHLLNYEVAKVYRENLQVKAYASRKKEETEEMAECSFQPKLNRKYENSPERGQDFYTGVPRGFKKTVERLQVGDHQRVIRQAERDRIPRGENYEKNRRLEFSPPAFLERPKIKKEEVLVYVDVNIGPGRSGKIGIHRGDTAKELTKNFSKTYSLNAGMRESLEKLLQSYIDSYFAKVPTTEKEVTGRKSNSNQEEEDGEEEEEHEEGEENEEEEEDEEEEN